MLLVRRRPPGERSSVSPPRGTRWPRPAAILGDVRQGVLAGAVLIAAAVAESAARAAWAPHTVGHNLLTESVSQTVPAGTHARGAVIVHAASASSAPVLGLLFLVAVFTTAPLLFLGSAG